jgi:hypothetical protein
MRDATGSELTDADLSDEERATVTARHQGCSQLRLPWPRPRTNLPAPPPAHSRKDRK